MAASTEPWRMLNTVRTIVTGQVQEFNEAFDAAMGTPNWTHPTSPAWNFDSSGSTVLPTVNGATVNGLMRVTSSVNNQMWTALLADQDMSVQSYREISLHGWRSYAIGPIYIYLAMDMDDTSPWPLASLYARFAYQEPLSNLSIYLNAELLFSQDVVPPPVGSAIPQSARMTIDNTNTLRVYWLKYNVPTIVYQLGNYVADGNRVGFGIRVRDPGATVTAAGFGAKYFSSSGALPETTMVGSSGGTVYYESTSGNMTQVNSALTTRSDKWISSATRLDKLYIADYGVRSTNSVNNASTSASTLTDAGADFVTDGVDADDDMVEITASSDATALGTYPISSITDLNNIVVTGTIGVGSGSNVGYRVMRSPKVFDAEALTLTRLIATAGFIPPDCKIVVACYDRLCWAGDDNLREAVYMSKIGEPTDYNYGTNLIDEAFVYDPAIVAGSPSIGDQVTALIPHLDDYLLIGCKRSIWIQRGDPALGAPPEAISREIGILQQSSWCYTPDNTIVAMTLDGLYLIEPSPESVPVRLSRDRMPQELVNIDPNLYQVLLEYDTLRNGINIFVTPNNPGPTTHFWFGWTLKEFSPESYNSNFEPTAITSHAISGVGPRRVVFGCRDGYIRVSEDSAKTDDGENFNSNVLIGPIMLGGGGYYDGMLREVVAQLAEDSGDVTLKIRVGDSIESAFRAASRVQYVMRAGMNRTWRPNLRGSACFLELTSEGGTPWALEQMSIVRERLGKQRLLA